MKNITIDEYNKRMDKIIAKKGDIVATLQDLLEEANKYTIIGIKNGKHGKCNHKSNHRR